MRAARLLDMLLVLQRQGRSTARELAATFEVSQRTILRDVEALSEAGVPIFTSRGAGGGIELLDGFRTHLTALTTDEARCLFLAGQPQVAHRLGLGVPTRRMRSKLLDSMDRSIAAEADSLSGWFLHDPDPWGGTVIPHGELRRLASSIQTHRMVEVTIGQEPAVAVQPLGLVLKAGSWYLVCQGAADIGAICIDDLRATRLTNRRCAPPDGFDLTTFWRQANDGLVSPGRGGGGARRRPAGRPSR